RVKTSGIDFDLAYQLPTTGDFRFRARAIASYLINRDNYTDISRPDFINQQKLELGDPEWQATLNLGFGFKKFDLDYTLRYVGGTTVSAEYENMNSVQGRPPLNPDQFPFTFYPDFTYHDIRGTLNLKQDASVFFGIDNVLDTMPPFGLMGTEAGAGVYPNTGRFFYLGVDFRF
ncbi:MAG: TonB-dependent receptor domain-containing protein, partial [Sandaracinobacter sp.]